MRLLLFCLFLLLPTLTLGQSACYLFVGGELGSNSSKIDSIIRPLLATFVAPLLKKYGFGATFFITEGFGFAKDKKNFMTLLFPF